MHLFYPYNYIGATKNASVQAKQNYMQKTNLFKSFFWHERDADPKGTITN